jgi:hypothetical protein
MVGFDTNWAGVGFSLLLFRRTLPWLDTTLCATPGRWGDFHPLRVDEMGYVMINDVRYYSDQAKEALGDSHLYATWSDSNQSVRLVRCMSSLI